MLDVMVQAVLDVVCSPQDAHHSMGWAAVEKNLLFYTDDGRIAGRYHEWVQDALTATVENFHKMGLTDNL